ncbi:TPA: thiazole synthase, partial [Clostridium perfringens]
INMARAFKMAVEGGRLAYEAKMGRESKFGNASSPLTGFLD